METLSGQGRSIEFLPMSNKIVIPHKDSELPRRMLSAMWESRSEDGVPSVEGFWSQLKEDFGDASESIVGAGYRSLLLLASLMIVFVFASSLVLLVNRIPESVSDRSSAIEITAFAHPGHEIKNTTLSALRSRPGVTEVRVKTSSQSLDDLREFLDDDGELLTGVPDSVLPESLVLSLSPDALAPDAMTKLAEDLKRFEEIAEVVVPHEIAQAFSRLLGSFKRVGAGFVFAIVLVGSIVMALFVVQALASRWSEIELRFLLGATRSRVIRPFLLELIVLVVVAFSGGAMLLFVILYLLKGEMAAIPLIAFVSVSTSQVFLEVVGVAVMIGIVVLSVAWGTLSWKLAGARSG